MKMNNGMKTTEEQQQQNEIKLAYKRNGMDKQNCPKGVQKHWQDPTKTQLYKKLVISVKNVYTQFLFPCFKL
jgi:hypothetical protein